MKCNTCNKIVDKGLEITDKNKKIFIICEECFKEGYILVNLTKIRYIDLTKERK